MRNFLDDARLKRWGAGFAMTLIIPFSPSTAENVEWRFTPTHWRNLVKMQNRYSTADLQHWYVCGKRALIYHRMPVYKMADDFELMPKNEWDKPLQDDEFIAQMAEYVDVQTLSDENQSSGELISLAQVACSGRGVTEIPVDLLVSRSTGNTLYTIVAKSFKLSNGIRTFWSSESAGRIIKTRIRKESDFYKKWAPTAPYLFDSPREWHIVKKTPSAMNEFEVNCLNETYRVKRRVTYGSTSGGDQAFNGPFQSIVPYSTVESIVKFACLIS